MKALHLYIDRIVVEGLTETEQRRFASALENRLREMAESSVADQFTRNTRKSIAALNVGQLRPGATAEQAAALIAASIRQSIGAPGRSHGVSGQGISVGGEGGKHV